MHELVRSMFACLPDFDSTAACTKGVQNFSIMFNSHVEKKEPWVTLIGFKQKITLFPKKNEQRIYKRVFEKWKQKVMQVTGWILIAK